MFFRRKYTFTICVRCVWIVIGYFLFEKEAFNGLLKVIDIQKKFIEHISKYFLIHYNQINYMSITSH